LGFSVPAGATGTTPISVKTPNGTATGTDQFTVTGTVAAPVITQQPVSQSVKAGSGAAFSVAVSNESGVSYQWFRNGVSVAGATGKALLISPAQPANAGTYKVNVSNGGGVTSSANVQLSIINAVSAPVITQQPVSQSVKAGSAVAFSVAVSNESGVSYQWFRNGVSVAGATGKALSISPAQPANAGTYKVNVSNGGGVTSSANVQLSIINAVSAPVITQQPVSLSVEEGAPAFFKVAVSNGTGVTFQWFRNDLIISGATASEFKIVASRLTDAGSYRVAVSDAKGFVASNTVALRVNPLITSAAPSSFIYWGANSPEGRLNVPNNLSSVIAMDAGFNHSVALKADGTVIAWGGNGGAEKIATVPASLSNVTEIDCGWAWTLARKSDGSLFAWGANDCRQVSSLPSGKDFVQISAGNMHGAALRADGTIVCWGRNDMGQCAVPSGLKGVKKVIAYGHHTMALCSDGSVRSWGVNVPNFRLAAVPSGLSGVMSIAAGGGFCLALKADGTVVAWGDNSRGQTDVPAGLNNVSKIFAMASTAFAIKKDGVVVSWGENSEGQRIIPALPKGRVITEIRGDAFHAFALSSAAESVTNGSASSTVNEPPSFVSGMTFDLGDIVGGGNGLGVPLPGNAGKNGMDPSTGGFVSHLNFGHVYHNRYNPSLNSNFVDGVFVLGSNKINSAGGIYNLVQGDASHASFDHITNNREVGGSRAIKLKGKEYASGVGMHSGAGITFNLKEFRNRSSATNFVFTSNFGTMSGGAWRARGYVVLSNGSQVLSEDVTPLMTSDLSPFVFNVKIPANADFLTLMVGTGGDGITDDHCGFGGARITSVAGQPSSMTVSKATPAINIQPAASTLTSPSIAPSNGTALQAVTFTPTITQQPASLSVKTGSSASFAGALSK
jgi:hypothetical protein